MTQIPTLTGQDIGQAERSTRALLDTLLSETGTPFEHWVTLRLLATSATAFRGDELVARMSSALKIAPVAVRSVLTELDAVHLIDGGKGSGDVTLTSAGVALYERINAGASAIAARLYGDLPVDDLVAAHRVLVTVTERANRELTRSGA